MSQISDRIRDIKTTENEIERMFACEYDGSFIQEKLNESERDMENLGYLISRNKNLLNYIHQCELHGMDYEKLSKELPYWGNKRT